MKMSRIFFIFLANIFVRMEQWVNLTICGWILPSEKPINALEYSNVYTSSLI